jgi:hypothetical protein
MVPVEGVWTLRAVRDQLELAEPARDVADSNLDPIRRRERLASDIEQDEAIPTAATATIIGRTVNRRLGHRMVGASMGLTGDSRLSLTLSTFPHRPAPDCPRQR